MATYAIGDIQGCFQPLQRLLQKISFDQAKDTLWFTGDLVNRGPQSLEVLRFISSLPDSCYRTVLGNHDLHLIACAYGARQVQPGDTLTEILNAADCEQLIAWLIKQPLLVHDEKLNYVMTHAGIPPLWDLAEAKRLAQEVESILRGKNPETFLKAMYGNEPRVWRNDLSGNERLRVIVNYFTRMRFCDVAGGLDLGLKGGVDKKSLTIVPWFELPRKTTANIVFGHWAALQGKTGVDGIFALDTGCVWGGELTAMCLETKERITAT